MRRLVPSLRRTPTYLPFQFQLRLNSSLIPKQNEPPSKRPHGIFSDLGDSEANKPMFEQLALLTPVIIPSDPKGVIRTHDSAARLLDNSALVIERRLELLNVFIVSPFESVLIRDLNNVIDMLLWTLKANILGICIEEMVDLDILRKKMRGLEVPLNDKRYELIDHLKRTFSIKKETSFST